MLILRSAWVLGFAAAATACAGSESDTKTPVPASETPVVNAGPSGSIVVNLPAGVTPDATADLRLDDAPIQIGVQTGIALGTHRLTVNGITDPNVVIGGSTAYTLSAVKIHLPSTPTVGINVARYVSTTDPAQSDKGHDEIVLSPSDPQNGTATTGASITEGQVMLVPHIAGGALIASWGVGDGRALTVRDGEMTVLDTDDVTDRFVTRIVAPATRGPGSVDALIAEVGQNREVVSLPDGQTVLVGLMNRVALTVGMKGAWGILLPTASGLPASTQLEHLAIPDVEVTNADGTKSTVKGTYLITQHLIQIDGTPADVLTAGDYTGTGVDLWPGSTYTIETHYKTADGVDQVESHDVTM